MLLCSEAETARGSEIERLGITRQFADHAGNLAAAEPLFQREQQVLRLLRQHVDQPVAYRLREPWAIGPPGQPRRRPVLHPQYGTAILQFCTLANGLRTQFVERQCQRQPCPAAFAGAGKDLAVPRELTPPGKPRPPAVAARGKHGRGPAR